MKGKITAASVRAARRADPDGKVAASRIRAGRKARSERAKQRAEERELDAALQSRGSVQQTADPAQPPAFAARPPRPAEHAKNYAQFATHLHKHKPQAAKIIDEATGAMLVYCEGVNVYFRNSPLALRALKFYGVAL